MLRFHSDNNDLDRFNRLVEERVTKARDRINKAHDEVRHIEFSLYPFSLLRKDIGKTIQEIFPEQLLTPRVDIIDRKQFDADLTVKVPELLKLGGPPKFRSEFGPKILAALQSSTILSSYIERVDLKDIYINIRLTDKYLFNTLESVLRLEGLFGSSDTEIKERIVIDYSSPNAAKLLHAGHIRSTIVGHVISNLHQSCGAYVYRVNHINDIGGFGFLLEGYRRWREKFPKELTQNEKLLELYTIRRTFERSVEHKGTFTELSKEAQEIILRYLGRMESIDQFREEFAKYVTDSDAAFRRLEKGDRAEVELWKEMVGWSMDDFEKFYSLLGIHLDFPIGESFYIALGNSLVDEKLKSGQVVLFNEELARIAGKKLDDLLAKQKIEQAEYKSLQESILRDVGAIVVQLDNGERFVVRRSDGLTIYSTRDIGAIWFRKQCFGATQLLYVVGQEQQDHFKNLFEAVEKLGICSQNETKFRHIYFGFYVDAKTKKKLSSREGAGGVHQLLTRSIDYFYKKYEESTDIPTEERNIIARELAVGSLVFNDLKQDMKGSVDIETTEINKTIEQFEKSGGAYVVYSACRARAILRRYGKELPKISEINFQELNSHEISLIKNIQEFPAVVASAALGNNPSIVLRHLLDTAQIYNSYYADSPVIKGEAVNHYRLIITASIKQMLENGLKICHINCPDRI